MYAIDSKPTPDDRHVCVIWLSRAGYVMGADGRPVEAEPSPASVVAEVAEKHLCARLFPPGRYCMSRVQICEVSSLQRGLETWPDMRASSGITSPSRLPHLSLTAACRTSSPRDSRSLGHTTSRASRCCPSLRLPTARAISATRCTPTCAPLFLAPRSPSRSPFSARRPRQSRPSSRLV